MSDKLSDKMDALYGGYAKTIAKQNCRIADLERQLAEAEGYPGIAHDFETTRRELEEARTEIANRAHTEEQYRRQLAEKQAEIDRLMLEFCPEKMTQEQKETWASHQKPAADEARKPK